MIESAHHLPVSSILAKEENVSYFIPKYQREYIWSKDNREALFNDIVENDIGHFIGSMICITDNSEHGKIKYEVIDGQQRLTTISILYAAIYKKFVELTAKDEKAEGIKYECKDKDEEDEITSERTDTRKRLIINKEGSMLKLELSVQNKNMDDYKSLLSKEVGILNFDSKVLNKGNRLIYKSYRFFEDKIKEYDLKEVRDLLKRINSVSVVMILVNSHSSAFILFESLNNRGVPLTAIDLIKNKLLSELDGKMGVDKAFEKWNQIISNLSDDYTIQERFLRHYYNAFKFQDNIKISNVSKATKSTLIKIYEELVTKDANFMIEEFVKKSYSYKCFVSPNEDDENHFIFLNKKLADLIRVKAAPCYLLLLYLSTKNINDEDKFYEGLTDLLIKYFVRRNITDFPNTRNLDQIFIELVQELEQDEKNLNLDFIVGYLSNPLRMSILSLFKEKLEGDIYEINTDMARFILSKIEEEHLTKERQVDLWARDKSDKLVWTIEHIFPEGSNIPQSRIDMIADGDKAKAKEIQENHVHKLGNLTLTGYNSNLSNFPFEKKQKREDVDGNYIGYKNGLYLNEDLKDMGKWTKEDIEVRTDKLINKTIEMFSVVGK